MASPSRERLTREILLRLGSGMIDVELDPDHINLAIDLALDRYRQRSQNSMEESFVFLDTQPDQNVYTLPNEVQEVRTVYRRGIGGIAGGAQIDPFSLAFTQNIYMIQNPGAFSTGGAGFLATYDFAMQYQELAGRMFGRDIQIIWDTATKRLTFQRRIQHNELVVVHVYNARPEEILLNEVYAKPWLRDYAIAQCKLMLAEARSLFSSIGGPQGGVSMNGDAVREQANAELERLEKELSELVDSHEGYGFIIG